jgi:hypothetical protein
MYEGCRYLGSCGSKKVEENEDEGSNLATCNLNAREAIAIATGLEAPKSWDLS